MEAVLNDIARIILERPSEESTNVAPSEALSAENAQNNAIHEVTTNTARSDEFEIWGKSYRIVSR